MTVTNQEQTQEQSNVQPNDKEYNFGQIRQQLERERMEKQQIQAKVLEMEEKAARLEKIINERTRHDDDDDDDDEPYVAPKRLKKETRKIKQEIKDETNSDTDQKIARAIEEERRKMWLDQNPDFYEIMNHVNTFAEKAPNLAKSILTMPDVFERQKLVYENIKSLGLHKKEEPKPSIQETVDRNRRTPFYQPSGMATPPYGGVSVGKDYSQTEMKTAYDHIKKLQSTLRLQ